MSAVAARNRPSCSSYAADALEGPGLAGGQNGAFGKEANCGLGAMAMEAGTVPSQLAMEVLLQNDNFLSYSM